MRPFPAAKKHCRNGLVCAVMAVALSVTVAWPAHAQQTAAEIEAAVADRIAAAMRDADGLDSGYRGSAGMPQRQSLYNRARNTETMTAEELQQRLSNREDPKTKAFRLAEDAARTNFGKTDIVPDAPDILEPHLPPPPEMETLQYIHKAKHGGNDLVTDTLISKEMALDMRRDAQREAALSYGARGGLAKRNYQLMERLRGYAPTLDSVFNFRQLLIRAPSGLMIEPPIVSESLEAIVITEGGREAAVADQILKINRQARIVTAPRDWRHYLVAHFESDIPPPPRVLWPKDAVEQAEWNGWVQRGWEAGYAQGEDIFETNLNRLVADYAGMVRYRTLLAEGKISQPYALHEDRGVTGGRGEMRVGDRALRITGPSEFLTGGNQWKPADR